MPGLDLCNQLLKVRLFPEPVSSKLLMTMIEMLSNVGELDSKLVIKVLTILGTLLLYNCYLMHSKCVVACDRDCIPKPTVGDRRPIRYCSLSTDSQAVGITVTAATLAGF